MRLVTTLNSASSQSTDRELLKLKMFLKLFNCGEDCSCMSKLAVISDGYGCLPNSVCVCVCACVRACVCA